MAHGDLSTLLAPGAKARNLDLKALLAIAAHEGAGGGIGDGGHAFGPFQLNNAGGVITGKFAGKTPDQINQWAWSPAGIKYALDGIAKTASGRTGADAITRIATDFERPQNVQGEIADALAHYGKGAGPVPSFAQSAATRQPMSVGAQPPSAAAPTGNLLSSLISRTNQSFGLGGSPQLASLLSPVNAAWGDHPGSGATVGGKAGQGQSGLPPLKPRPVASFGGIQVDPAITGQLQKIVGRFGVKPTSGYRSVAHNAQVGGAPHSDHLSGDAVDFGGTPSQLAALYKYAQGRFPYVEPMAQAKDHVHISFRR